MSRVEPQFTDSPKSQVLFVSPWRLEQGFGSALAIGSLAIASTCLFATSIAFDLALAKVRVQLVADGAALAASDTFLGLVAGFPCENAEEFVQREGLKLATCRIVGLGASIEVEYPRLFTTLGASASAMAPGSI